MCVQVNRKSSAFHFISIFRSFFPLFLHSLCLQDFNVCTQFQRQDEGVRRICICRCLFLLLFWWKFSQNNSLFFGKEASGGKWWVFHLFLAWNQVQMPHNPWRSSGRIISGQFSPTTRKNQTKQNSRRWQRNFPQSRHGNYRCK